MAKKDKSGAPRGRLLWKVLCGVFAFLFVFLLIAGPIANNYATIINMVLGIEGSTVVGDAAEDLPPRFVSDFETSAEQASAADLICESVVANGAVLLLNRNGALPLAVSEKISLFGTSSARFVYGGTGSGGMDNSKAIPLKDALEQDGFKVNPTLWAFYREGAGSKYGLKDAGGSLNNYIFKNEEFAVNEVPQSVYTAAEWDSVKEYGDAAVVVIGRVCGEGKDLPVAGASDAGGNMLSISQEERDLLKKLAEMKAAGTVGKIVVLLNTANAVEVDVLEPEVCGVDYMIDACLWVGNVGQSGIRAIGDLLSGKINPSGRLVDTYCYDNTTSPAVQNAYVTSYTNAAEKGLAFAKTNNEYYVVYQEGIYIGYRYYETRYEDMVLGNANVGDYDYAKTVAFPFGYGLNYSGLTYGKLNMKENGTKFDFTVDVTNPSDRDAREAVLIYMQSPYTEYDRQNGIEKAAVELVGYTKVDVPAGKTVSASVTVDKSEMRAYDANGKKTYIVDEGNYYFATGNGAHEALNNILMLKAAQNDTSNGTVDTAKMVGEGRADLAVTFKQAKMDDTAYATARTGNAITNQLDHGDLNKFDADPSNDVKYLTRADWAGTMPRADLSGNTYKAAVQMAANDELVKALNTIIDSEKKGTMPTMGKEGELTLAHFIGVPLDGSITLQNGKTYTWDDLMDQVKFNEMTKLIGQTYHATAAVKSVGKPATKDENGPQGITATLTGGSSSTSYISEDVMAATFDPAIAEAVGRSMGNDCLMANRKAYSGIYGPGANIHRTPYSGRNFEYYSEDPFISGKTCAAETRGIQSKGVYVYNKHFCFNDQETGRDGICVWTNEQAAREIYLQAFEYPITDANAYCVMTSFNRLGATWAGGDYNLITNILRGEFGMPGFALTDFSNNNSFMDVIQGLLAGGDGWDCNDASKWSDKLKTYSEDPQVVSAMREATKHILYTVANSNAMNGMGFNTIVEEVHGWWQDAITYGQIGTGVLAALFLVIAVLDSRKAKKKAA
ncbi:MAG: glycoside hydrolase family 3 protein [Clostridia bacterium]|nr:glycoside hydrolase family 3 protein [Clostridia bacterium]